uniref:G-protein coupled receptors family 1 profile domain-containing protein n=1 Tax=Globodera rostochiensis TaxID=31243 RepID=A0A914H4C0_GLORO
MPFVDPSPIIAQSIDDLLAGSALLLTALTGILLLIVEVIAMIKLMKKVIGFCFFIILSIADFNLLLLFGIVPGVNYGLHILADTVWYAGCYMNVLIGISRFACVVFPLHFRLLCRQSTCWTGGIVVWTFALAQSWAMNSVPWFVMVWYEAGTYGMTCDWVAYAESGTRTMYLALNGIVIVAYLLIYASTALIIFTKKAVRLRFVNAVLKPKFSAKCQTQNKLNNNNNNNNNQSKSNVADVNGTRRSSDEIELNPKNTQGILQQRSYSNNNILIRTVNILRLVSSAEASHSMELRLVIPCCVNALIFIVGQLLIINGGIGPQGKWSDLSVMLIFCLQSIAPSILRLIFSKALRRQFMSLLRLKCQTTMAHRTNS